jgi:hypothetical protein
MWGMSTQLKKHCVTSIESSTQRIALTRVLVKPRSLKTGLTKLVAVVAVTTKQLQRSSYKEAVLKESYKEAGLAKRC